MGCAGRETLEDPAVGSARFPDSLERQVCGSVSSLFAPQIEQPSIAQRHEFRRRKSQPLTDRVDPVWRSLELCENTDRSLIEHAVAGCVAVFRAPLLIGEGLRVPKLRK